MWVFPFNAPGVVPFQPLSVDSIWGARICEAALKGICGCLGCRRSICWNCNDNSNSEKGGIVMVIVMVVTVNGNGIVMIIAMEILNGNYINGNCFGNDILIITMEIVMVYGYDNTVVAHETPILFTHFGSFFSIVTILKTKKNPFKSNSELLIGLLSNCLILQICIIVLLSNWEKLEKIDDL